MKTRGVHENPPDSGIWWVHWYDNAGKRHREKAATKVAAIKLKAKRTTESWRHVRFRRRVRTQ
jgi:hypothetical protein